MRKIIMIIFYTIITLIFSGTSFLIFSPQFGESPSSQVRDQYENLDNYSNGQFKNEESFTMMTGKMSMTEFISGDSGRMKPENIIPL